MTVCRALVRPWGPDGAYVEIPSDLGPSPDRDGRAVIRGRINGVSFEKRLALRSGNVYRMAIGKALRAQAGVRVGDEIALALDGELD